MSVEWDDEALVVRSERRLAVLSSAPVGGGWTEAHTLVNRHVHKHYTHPDPAQDLRDFARSRGIQEPFVGLMTAVFLRHARAVTLADGELRVAALVTAGVGNATAAGLSEPYRPPADSAAPPAGTINLILLIDGHLGPSAMVNAVITATEAKAAALRDADVHTADGLPATGTSTDTVTVACTGRGQALAYAGPATAVGWLIGRAVRQATAAALAAKDAP
jgi:iron complex transport system ATP-binding protein